MLLLSQIGHGIWLLIFYLQGIIIRPIWRPVSPQVNFFKHGVRFVTRRLLNGLASRCWLTVLWIMASNSLRMQKCGSYFLLAAGITLIKQFLNIGFIHRVFILLPEFTILLILERLLLLLALFVLWEILLACILLLIAKVHLRIKIVLGVMMWHGMDIFEIIGQSFKHIRWIIWRQILQISHY